MRSPPSHPVCAITAASPPAQATGSYFYPVMPTFPGGPPSLHPCKWPAKLMEQVDGGDGGRKEPACCETRVPVGKLRQGWSLSSLSLHAAPWPWHKTLSAHPNTAGPLLPCWISSALNVGPSQNLSLPACARALEREQRRRHIVGDPLCMGVTGQQAGLLADPPGSVVQPGCARKNWNSSSYRLTPGVGSPTQRSLLASGVGHWSRWVPKTKTPYLQLLQTPKNPANTPNSGNPAAARPG